MSGYDAPPFFDGDDWHELRAEQVRRHGGTLRALATTLESLYRNCWVVAGNPLDPVKRAFDEESGNDLRPLRAIHDLLAACWRESNGYTQPSLSGTDPGIPLLVDDWQRWLCAQPAMWLALEPGFVRSLVVFTSGYRNNLTRDVLESWNVQFFLGRIYDLDILGGEAWDADSAG